MTQEPIGVVSVDALSFEEKLAFIGCVIGECTHRRQGYVKEAIRALMDFYSQKGAVGIFYAKIKKDNIASINTVDSLGFKEHESDQESVLMEYRQRT